MARRACLLREGGNCTEAVSGNNQIDADQLGGSQIHSDSRYAPHIALQGLYRQND